MSINAKAKAGAPKLLALLASLTMIVAGLVSVGLASPASATGTVTVPLHNGQGTQATGQENDCGNAAGQDGWHFVVSGQAYFDPASFQATFDDGGNPAAGVTWSQTWTQQGNALDGFVKGIYVSTAHGAFLRDASVQAYGADHGTLLNLSHTCGGTPPLPPFDQCHDIEGNQPAGTDCTPLPPFDQCQNIEGNQPAGTDCTPLPPFDQCHDIEGNQPAGTDCTPPLPPFDQCHDIEGNQPAGTDCTPLPQGNPGPPVETTVVTPVETTVVTPVVVPAPAVIGAPVVLPATVAPAPDKASAKPKPAKVNAPASVPAGVAKVNAPASVPAGVAKLPVSAAVPSSVPAGDGPSAPALPMWALAMIALGALGAAGAGMRILGDRK